MMPHDQDPHGIADDAKQKVVREAMEVDAPKIMLADGKRLRSLRRLHHEAP